MVDWLLHGCTVTGKRVADGRAGRRVGVLRTGSASVSFILWFARRVGRRDQPGEARAAAREPNGPKDSSKFCILLKNKSLARANTYFCVLSFRLPCFNAWCYKLRKGFDLLSVERRRPGMEFKPVEFDG